MPELFTTPQLLVELADEIAEKGSAKAWADEHGLSEQYVSDVRNCRRPPGPSICAALGFEAMTMYRPLPNKEKPRKLGAIEAAMSPPPHCRRAKVALSCRWPACECHPS